LLRYNRNLEFDCALDLPFDGQCVFNASNSDGNVILDSYQADEGSTGRLTCVSMADRMSVQWSIILDNLALVGSCVRWSRNDKWILIRAWDEQVGSVFFKVNSKEAEVRREITLTMQDKKTHLYRGDLFDFPLTGRFFHPENRRVVVDRDTRRRFLLVSTTVETGTYPGSITDKVFRELEFNPGRLICRIGSTDHLIVFQKKGNRFLGHIFDISSLTKTISTPLKILGDTPCVDPFHMRICSVSPDYESIIVQDFS
jgi:hypothetical protein